MRTFRPNTPTGSPAHFRPATSPIPSTSSLTAPTAWASPKGVGNLRRGRVSPHRGSPSRATSSERWGSVLGRLFPDGPRQLDPGIDPKLFEDVSHMGVDSVRRDVQGLGDLPIRSA